MMGEMFFVNALIFMFVFQHEVTSILIANYGQNERDTNNHLCSKTERYVEEKVMKYNETFLEQKIVWCLKIPPKCTRYSEATREISKKIYVPKLKTVHQCCEGYVKKNGKCEAICSYGCVHGKCTKPKTCTCDEGWHGPNCTTECDEGWYGEGCKMYCSCQNGATCDRKNGFCHCPPGFAGTFCESLCYQENCENECHCKNGGVCNFMDNTCECPPGYVGRYCENQCQDGTYGYKCMNNCSCNDLATISCNPINGKCMCVPGWKGDGCFKKCDLNTWGAHCSKKCKCPPKSICDNVSGNCSCEPGWHGLMCEKKCSDGYFGKDCNKKCADCMFLPGTCHYITGQCSCPAGSRGSNCDLECPKNRYGESCIYECSCSNNSSCDPENGVCTCLPGWMGENCSIPCGSGMYGFNCSLFCNCSENYTCNSVSGECLCDSSYSSLCNLQLTNTIKAGAAIEETESSLDIFIILLVSCVLLGVLLLISFVLCITKRAKSRSRLQKEENSSTNAIKGNSSPSISSYRFMNPNYETADSMETTNKILHLPFSSPISFTEKKDNDEWNLEEEEFGIPDCDKASSLKEQYIEICFSNGQTQNAGIDVNCNPEVRYSKTTLPTGICDEETSSQTSSIYADVEYKNEDHPDMLKNPAEKEMEGK